jgi:hypothetical protein
MNHPTEHYIAKRHFKVNQTYWNEIHAWQQHFIAYYMDKLNNLDNAIGTLEAYRRLKIEHPHAKLIGTKVMINSRLYGYNPTLKRLVPDITNPTEVQKYTATRPTFHQ